MSDNSEQLQKVLQQIRNLFKENEDLKKENTSLKKLTLDLYRDVAKLNVQIHSNAPCEPRELTPKEIELLRQSKKEITERVKELWNKENVDLSFPEIDSL